MVIYARGGSEGTAAEAASRTGRRAELSKLLLKSLPPSFKTAPKYTLYIARLCL